MRALFSFFFFFECTFISGRSTLSSLDFFLIILCNSRKPMDFPVSRSIRALFSYVSKPGTYIYIYKRRFRELRLSLLSNASNLIRNKFVRRWLPLLALSQTSSCPSASLPFLLSFFLFLFLSISAPFRTNLFFFYKSIVIKMFCSVVIAWVCFLTACDFD